MVIKNCNTVEQYKIQTYLSTKLDIDEFTISLIDRDTIEITYKTG